MPNHDPYEGVVELAARIRTGETTPVEVAEATLNRIHQLDPQLHAWVHVSDEAVLADAERATIEVGAGQPLGSLHGVPVGIKDNCFTKDAVTTNGQPLLDGFRPAYDATVVARLREAGAIILGKTSQTEGAFAEHRVDQDPPVNPWNAEYWAGTSSSGSGVATATGMSYAALGTDTGGSICYPSAMSGLTGVKPTWGRVSRYGVAANSESLDHVGPMARSAQDAAAILQVIAGLDSNDRTSSNVEVPDYLRTISDDIAGIRIGIAPGYGDDDGVDTDVVGVVDDAVTLFKSLGLETAEITFPSWEVVARDWSTISSVEMAHAHRDTYPSEGDRYGRALAGFIDQGRESTGLDYFDATKRRLELRGLVDQIFAAVDVLILPAMSSASRTLKRMNAFDSDASQIDDLLRFTAPFDMSGNPAITLPAGATADGTPIAFQIVGPHFGEAMLFRMAHAFQQQTDWHRRRPLMGQ